MAKRSIMFASRGTGPSAAQQVIRLITILVVVVGVALVGIRYFVLSPKPEKKPPEEEGILIDTRTWPFPGAADNAVVAPPVDDNAAEVEAIVGLDSIRDGADIEPQPLFYLLREVEQKCPADNLFMKRAPVVTPVELRKNPDKWRVKPVTVRGKLRHVETSTLPENPSGIREVLDGYVVVGREGVCRFFATRPGRFRKGQDVIIHGLFMQLLRETDKGERSSEAPLVVTSHLVTVPPPDAPVRPVSFTPIISALVGLGVVYLVLMYVLRRRQQRGNRLLEARRKARSLTSSRPESENPEADYDHGPR